MIWSRTTRLLPCTKKTKIFWNWIAILMFCLLCIIQYCLMLSNSSRRTISSTENLYNSKRTPDLIWKYVYDAFRSSTNTFVLHCLVLIWGLLLPTICPFLYRATMNEVGNVCCLWMMVKTCLWQGPSCDILHAILKNKGVKEKKWRKMYPFYPPCILLRFGITIWDLVLQGFGSISRILFLQF